MQNRDFPKVKNRLPCTRGRLENLSRPGAAREFQNSGQIHMSARISLCALAAFILAATSGPAFAQKTIGKASEVESSVTGTVRGSASPINPGDRVYQDETVETGAGAKALLTFADNTTFSVGANAKVVLDSFIYNPSTRNGKIAISASKGAFRFVTGLGRKKIYRIKTPTASIGVRGTTFHLFVLSTGSTAIALEHGELEVCNASRTECRRARQSCRVTFALLSGQITREMRWGRNHMPQISRSRAFPFLKACESMSGINNDDGNDSHESGGHEPNTEPQPGPEPDYGDELD